MIYIAVRPLLATATRGVSTAGWHVTSADPEQAFSTYLQAYADWDGPKYSFVLRHPGRSISAALAVVRLQRLTASPSATPNGDAIRVALQPRSTFWRTWAPVTAVLPLPACPGDFDLGRQNQTLRRQVRRAQRTGIRWATIEDPAERLALLELAADSERAHPIDIYRIAEPDNRELLAFPLWIAAYATDGRPLLLSVTPVDGQWALLRYFRTIGSGQEQSHARYLALHALATHLASLGVRYLFDQASPATLPPGLRHYQRMIGFRIFRVRLGKPD